MKLYILTLTKEIEYYNFDLEEIITEYRNIYAGVFDSRNKAKNTAKKYLDGSSFDINTFHITECKVNNIVKIEK